LKKRLKLWIDCLKSKAKKLLKQRVDSPFEKEMETKNKLPNIQGQKVLKQRSDFPFKSKNKTMDRLPNPRPKSC